MKPTNSKGINSYSGKVEERHEEIINWLNSLPLSKPVKNVERDFSDAGVHSPSFSPQFLIEVLVAELIAQFLPRYVPLNSFVHVHSVALKKYNWESLDKSAQKGELICIFPPILEWFFGIWAFDWTRINVDGLPKVPRVQSKHFCHCFVQKLIRHWSKEDSDHQVEVDLLQGVRQFFGIFG